MQHDLHEAARRITLKPNVLEELDDLAEATGNGGLQMLLVFYRNVKEAIQ